MAPRVGIGAASLALAAGVVAGAAACAAFGSDGRTVVSFLADGRGWTIAIAIGALGWGLLGLGLALADSRPLSWGIGLLAAAWLASVPGGGPWRAALPLVAAALLATAELAYWSLEHRVRSADEAAVGRGRATGILLLAAGGGVLAAVPLTPLSAGAVPGEVLTAFGAIAIVALLAVAVALGRGLGGPSRARR